MSKKLKMGILGAGVLGKYHTKLTKANPKAELVGIYDVIPAAAQALAREFETKAFDSIEALAAECDAITIAVPATKHAEAALPLIAQGKHLLVEKPIAATVEDARAMVDAAEKQGVVLAVGHVERFNPAMDYLEEHRTKTLFIEAHRLAKYPPPRPGQIRRGTEVSVVLDLMIHDLDLILTMVGDEVEKFDAVGVPILSNTEDIANVRIKFKNGAVANVTASRVSADPMRKFRVFQTDSYTSMDYATSTGYIYKKGFLGVGKKNLNLNEKNALADEIDNFINAVNDTLKEGKVVQPRVPGTQGLRALELAVAICDEIKAYNDKYGVYKFRK